MNELDDKQVENLIECGKILKNALDIVVKSTKAGVDTLYLDQIAESEIRKNKALPSFKDYFVAGAGKFPATLCVSINDEVVHGIPSKQRVLKEGDIISLDIGAGLNGIYTDMAVTVGIGQVSALAQKLIDVTEASLYLAIDQVKIGGHIGDIGHAVETYVKNYNFGVIRHLVGHGIGTQPHTDPQIPNYGSYGTGPIIRENEVLAIEPMITEKGEKIRCMADKWTIVTSDGGLSAHFEHTVIATKNGPLVVTK